MLATQASEATPSFGGYSAGMTAAHHAALLGATTAGGASRLAAVSTSALV